MTEKKENDGNYTAELYRVRLYLLLEKQPNNAL